MGDPGSRPWWRDGRVWILVLVTLLTLQVGWTLKAKCYRTDWNAEPAFQWRNYCYSDVQALYGTRGAGDGTWPYVETFNEYPPLIGVYMHTMGTLSDDRDGYLAVSDVGFSALAVLTTVLLGELVGRDRRILYWAAAPALALYGFYNWDLLAVTPTIGALLAFRKGHMGLAGLLLGLGASAKLYPAFLAPALGLWILRDDGGLKARGWRFGLGFAAMYAAIHLPFLVLNADLLLDGYRFQSGRSPNFETVWYAVGHLGREWGVAWMDLVDEKDVYSPLGLGALAAGLAVSGWGAWTRRLDPVAAACIPVFAFLAFNKVFSVQYTLWAIPLLVAVPVSRTLKALLVVADLAVFVSISQYFWVWEQHPHGHTFTPTAFAAVFRFAVYAAIAWHLAIPAWRRSPAAPSPAPAGPTPGPSPEGA